MRTVRRETLIFPTLIELTSNGVTKGSSGQICELKKKPDFSPISPNISCTGRMPMNDDELRNKLVIQLLKRAIEVEANEADIMFRAYLVEEDRRRKKAIFQIYKESELHRLILEDLLRFLGETPQAYSSFKEYDIEDMFGDQRLYVLIKVEEMARELYIDILEELERMCREHRDDGVMRVIETVSRLIEWEGRHISMVEKLTEC